MGKGLIREMVQLMTALPLIHTVRFFWWLSLINLLIVRFLNVQLLQIWSTIILRELQIY
jgi:hypothetical protein